MTAVEEPDSGRRFGIHPQLSQQRCKRPRYEANLLAKEFNKLGLSSFNSSEATEEASRQSCVKRQGEYQESQRTMLSRTTATPIGAVTSTDDGQTTGAGYSEGVSPQFSEFPCEAAAEQTQYIRP